MINLKMKSYKGGDLKGNYLFTRKLDGVCVILDCPSRTAMSKHGKPLYNFEAIFDEYRDMRGTFEVFRDNWETSVSLVRTMESDNKVTFYDLNPLDVIDIALWGPSVSNPTEFQVRHYLQQELDMGNEGLVLVPYDADGTVQWEAKRIKVKDEITIDIRVTGIQMGTGKYKGMLGAFMTHYGKVGTGFSDEQRVEFVKESFDTGRFLMVDMIIEVGFMEWTKDKKMRHPRFKRVRFDKLRENLER